MTDREKVLQALEHCDLCSDMPNCQGCAYLREPDCMEHLKRDIIALLKAQEPVEPTEPDEDNMRYCGDCGSPVGYEVLEAPGIEYVQYSYCPFCGRAVKWE